MAVSIPDSQFDKMTDKLPADKDALLIFYCGGLKCKLSHKSATKAEKLGYTNVKVFAEGYPKWISDKSNYRGCVGRMGQEADRQRRRHGAGGLSPQAQEV